MASHNAKAVAKDVIKMVRNGKKVNMQKIQQKHGYSKSSAKAMKATKTKAFKEEIKPVVDQMQTLRDKAVAALLGKNLKKEKLVALSILTKNLTHDIQLLTGGKTEDFGIEGMRKDIKDLINSVKND